MNIIHPLRVVGIELNKAVVIVVTFTPEHMHEVDYLVSVLRSILLLYEIL